MSTISETLDMIDNQISTADFLAEVRRSRFLRECKEKGFNRLIAAGLIGIAPKKRQPHGPPSAERKKEMADAVKRVNELRAKGMRVKEAILEVGIPVHIYTKWTQKLDMRFEGITPAECKMRVRQINSYRANGKTINEACRKAGVRVSTYYLWGERYGIKCGA